MRKIPLTNLVSSLERRAVTLANRLGIRGICLCRICGICGYLCIISLQTWGVNVRIKKIHLQRQAKPILRGRRRGSSGKSGGSAKKGEKVSKVFGVDRRDHRESFRLCARQGRRHGLNHRQRVSSDIWKLCLFSGSIDTSW